MKTLLAVMLGAFFFSVGAIAAPYGDPATAETVSPLLIPLHVQELATEGSVLKETQNSQTTKLLLIGMTATINIPNACTQFVGQITDPATTQEPEEITPMGAVDPVNDICIALAVAPIKRQLTVELETSFTDASRLSVRASKNFTLDGVTYQVTYHRDTQKVSVEAL